MYLSDTDWKVYDVALRGVSLVTGHCPGFGGSMHRAGMGCLIEQPRNRCDGAQDG